MRRNEVLPGLTARRLLRLINNQRHAAHIRQHPNGFLQLNLTGDWRGPGLRLHIWPDMELPSQGEDYQTHNHIFDFESAVLVGAIENSLYSVDHYADETATQTLYRAYGDPARSRLLAIDGYRRSATLVSKRVYWPGETYSLNRWDYHTSRPTKLPTATIISRTGASPTASPLIIGPLADQGELIQFDRTLIDQQDAWAAVEDIVETIERFYA